MTSKRKPSDLPKFLTSAKRPKTYAVTVTEIDNRGDENFPFGYVYFSDSNRLGFGDVADGIGPFGLFESNWGPVGLASYTLATEELTKLFPSIAAEYADKMKTEG